MKLVKKFLLGLTAVAVAAALVSCADITKNLNNSGEEEDDSVHGTIIQGTASNATVDFKNEDSNPWRREVDLLKTKHYGSRAKIVQENIDTSDYNGIMGYAFNVKENKNGDNTTYDLSIVGSTYFKGQPVTYVSVFRNVKKLNDDNLGAKGKHVYNAENDPDGSKFMADEEPCEYEVLQYPSGDPKTANLTKFAFDAEEKTYTVCIEVIAEDDGSYTVKYYDPAEAINATTGAWKLKSTLDGLTTQNVTISNKLTGYTEKTQAYLGVYTNVYFNKTMKGSWKLSKVAGEAEVEEF